MNIKGPFLNPRRKDSPKKWYLSYFVPKLGLNGAAAMKDGKVVMKRQRPHYTSKDSAEEDKPRIAAQYGVAGVGEFVQSRAAQMDYELARAVLPKGVTVLAAAQFYVKQNPAGETVTLETARTRFLTHLEKVVGKTRHYSDLKSRTLLLVAAFPGRDPNTLTRTEAINYLLNLSFEPRGKLNHKRAACTFFNWLLSERLVEQNPFGGIKRKQLPRVLKKEIIFLTLDETERYLRTLENYDSDLVAHEVIQLFAGVRADDEMADFRGEWVKANTCEVVTPGEMTKTGKREVISGLEENFWAWWKVYGREGVLRPKNYERRWWRIRILMQVDDPARRDELARQPVKTLIKTNGAPQGWPWNARRRTFCTYHIAKLQSAAKTALILRQAATESTTLHDSYRGLGVTQAMGESYFKFLPLKPSAS